MMLNRLSHIAWMVSIHADIFYFCFQVGLLQNVEYNAGEVKIICGAHSD